MVEAPKPKPLLETLRLARGLAGLSTLWGSGRDLPRGEGATVLVIPGFLTSDASTFALRGFLERLGYRAEGWSMGRNLGDVEKLVPRVADRVAMLAGQTQSAIKLVGWSLGGVLAREAARLAPEKVDRIVTMGTPVIGGPKYTVSAEYYRRHGFDLDEIERQVAEKNADPIPIDITAIYSRLDAVVAWEACIDDNPNNRVEHVEVSAGHVELGFSAEVFRIIARSLAARSP